MNENQEKQKLWQTYGLLIGVMLGGTLLTLGGQSAWNLIQQQSRSQSSEKLATLPNNSSTSSSQLQTESPEPSPITVSKPSAQQSLRDYYSTINGRQYQIAWNQLSSELRSSKTLHPDGFNSFVEWWEKVEQVKIQEVSSQESSTETATVALRVQYLMKSGRKVSHSLHFLLIWDATSQKWLIGKVKSI